MVLALLSGLLAACSSDAPASTEREEDPAQAGEADSPAPRDAGGAKKDAGRKDAAVPPADEDPDEPEDQPAAVKDAGGRADAGKDAGSSSPDAGATNPPAPVAGEVCARWKADRANLSEGTWTGNAESCQAGDMSAEARDNALRLVNLYRTLCGLPTLKMSEAGNKLAQDCALLMRANGTITHTPPSTFKCYTAEAAKTANSSSLSSGPGVGSVDGYMIDPGNPTTIGHRRWILSNWLSEMGFGSADRFSCQYQPAKPTFGGGGSGKAWAAWPPAGQVPIQAFGGRFLGTIDQTGWSLQSDTINLSSAKVTVSSGGADLPVTVTQLGSGYGSMYALRFNPMGWTSEAGKTYSVSVSGTSMPIAYDVEVVDCK
jgi:uncharacterized protein YkwD